MALSKITNVFPGTPAYDFWTCIAASKINFGITTLTLVS